MESPELTKIPVALTIAGSDSGGGAGIQADLKTFMALGVHGTSAIVSLTAQNTTGVSAVHDVPVDFIREQIAQVASDLDVAAAKTGMLSSSEIVIAVADAIREFKIPNLVVDPVFVSKNQDRLLSEKALGDLVERIIPLATVVTPNLYEAGALIGAETTEITEVTEMEQAARQIHEMGAASVLVKGGHLEGPAIDVFFDGETVTAIEDERIDSPHTHGTGCTLSAAIAAGLAKGLDPLESIREAKAYVTGAIRNGLAIGKGFGPTNHAWRMGAAEN